MAQATFSAVVEAPVETLWDLLIEKVEDPGRFIAGVEEVAILDRSDNGVLREMRVADSVTREWIRTDPERREVTFTLVDDPDYEGTVVNRVTMAAANLLPTLTFAMDWVPLDPSMPDDAEAAGRMIRNAVLMTKALAEQRAQQAEEE
jgi:hypothetical protein